MQVTTLPRHLDHLYVVPTCYRFKAILRDRCDQENLVELTTDSDRVCNVLAVVMQRYPGQALVDLWEVAPHRGSGR